MVTTFAEYLLVAGEGSFEMRPVSHNLISLCCSLSLSISSDRIREGMKEISCSSLYLGRQGSMWSWCCRSCVWDGFQGSGKERWVQAPGQGWGGEGGGSQWQRLVQSSQQRPGQLLLNEEPASRSSCLWTDFSPRQGFWKLCSSFK